MQPNAQFSHCFRLGDYGYAKVMVEKFEIWGSVIHLNVYLNSGINF